MLTKANLLGFYILIALFIKNKYFFAYFNNDAMKYYYSAKEAIEFGIFEGINLITSGGGMMFSLAQIPLLKTGMNGNSAAFIMMLFSGALLFTSVSYLLKSLRVGFSDVKLFIMILPIILCITITAINPDMLSAAFFVYFIAMLLQKKYGYMAMFALLSFYAKSFSIYPIIFMLLLDLGYEGMRYRRFELKVLAVLLIVLLLAMPHYVVSHLRHGAWNASKIHADTYMAPVLNSNTINEAYRRDLHERQEGVLRSPLKLRTYLYKLLTPPPRYANILEMYTHNPRIYPINKIDHINEINIYKGGGGDARRYKRNLVLRNVGKAFMYTLEMVPIIFMVFIVWWQFNIREKVVLLFGAGVWYAQVLVNMEHRYILPTVAISIALLSLIQKRGLFIVSVLLLMIYPVGELVIMGNKINSNLRESYFNNKSFVSMEYSSKYHRMAISNGGNYLGALGGVESGKLKNAMSDDEVDFLISKIKIDEFQGGEVVVGHYVYEKDKGL